MKLKNLLLPNQWANINQTWLKAWVKGIKIYVNEGKSMVESAFMHFLRMHDSKIVFN